MVSLISLAVLSYERYCTMMGTTEADATNYKKVWLGIFVSWMYSLFWTLPPLFGWSSYGPEGPGTTCSVNWHSRDANNISYIICLFVFCLVIPFFIIVYCYGKLLCAIKQVSGFLHLLFRKSSVVFTSPVEWQWNSTGHLMYNFKTWLFGIAKYMLFLHWTGTCHTLGQWLPNLPWSQHPFFMMPCSIAGDKTATSNPLRLCYLCNHWQMQSAATWSVHWDANDCTGSLAALAGGRDILLASSFFLWQNVSSAGKATQ